jgi:hypothetical protein
MLSSISVKMAVNGGPSLRSSALGILTTTESTGGPKKVYWSGFSRPPGGTNYEQTDNRGFLGFHIDGSLS